MDPIGPYQGTEQKDPFRLKPINLLIQSEGMKSKGVSTNHSTDFHKEVWSPAFTSLLLGWQDKLLPICPREMGRWVTWSSLRLMTESCLNRSWLVWYPLEPRLYISSKQLWLPHSYLGMSLECSAQSGCREGSPAVCSRWEAWPTVLCSKWLVTREQSKSSQFGSQVLLGSQHHGLFKETLKEVPAIKAYQ